MKIEFTVWAHRDLVNLPPNVKKQARKQLSLLTENMRHPSLHAKKYDEAADIWQGRVNQDYRFYFRIVADAYRILRIVAHPK